ncbi:MAG: NADH-quinone oxidoreductase subunit L [Candidatus Heimdallarchaeota archaeon]|nr:NADH-quinone oxidoreductase subunit L [Candidatus Heimdallarchaeota archaeon]
MANTILILASIAVLAPMVGAFLSLLLKKWPMIRDIFSVLPVAISAVMSIILFASIGIVNNDDLTFAWADWLNGDLLSGFYLDPLSGIMLLIVSILSMLIMFFSLEYMKDDENKARYWFFMQLFVGGMLLLILAADMILLFVGWEIVGLCSCFLIGHFYMKKGEEGTKPAKSGIKALIMTGIGDIGFLGFLAWAYYLNTQAAITNPLLIRTSNLAPYPVFMGILLLLAPITKSAQFPFQSWLSSGDTVDIDAMQGPTTVSALIHAATMVKAGVYLVARFSGIWNEQVFYIILMVLAGISCIGAAIGALVTTDLKRVLAYSTISQLSYMFLAFSIRGLDDGLIAGQLHLLSHSIFKALLFLSAGAIIHSVANERDITKMGGLRKELPWTYGFMLVGVLGLIGVPILTNGGYSKESIIRAAFIGTQTNPAYWFVLVVAVLTAFLTALYASRMFLMIFHGKNRGAHVHKPKYIMRITIGVLAVLVVATGFILEGPLHNLITGHIGDPYVLIPTDAGGIVALVSSLIAIILGIGLALLLYGKGQTEVKFVENIKPFKATRTFVENGFYMDHLYNKVFVKPLFWIGQKISFLKTGKINWNMILGSVVAVVTVVVLVAVMV